MARKSRKNVESALPRVNPVFRAGAYVRLSAVDRKQKGDSIENQQAIIAAYIALRDDLELIDAYIDNGISGQTLERPEFQRLLADLESGRIDCCVTKDLSRLGRNAIDTGYYVEKHFPTHGIRFIAINDGYDSAEPNSGGIMVSLKNMINEAYALEIGRKIHATKQMNIRNGCFVGRFPPYGYLKNSADKYKLVPDEYASVIVRRMYELAAENGVTAVLSWLNDTGVLPPKRYFHSIGLASEKEAGGHIHWNKGVVYAILKNRVYTGDMAQGKYITHSYDQKKQPETEWVVTPDTHEPIVSRELFAEVQNLWGRQGERPAKPYTAPKRDNIFLRKVFCGHCGYAMRRARTGETSYNLKCETRFYYTKDDCVPVSISENALKTELLALLQKQAAVFADATPSDAKPPDDGELRKIRAELDRNSLFFKGLYESLVSGDITADEYRELKSSYESKIDGLAAREREIHETARVRTLEAAARRKAAESYGAVARIADLTAETVDALIEKILVFGDGHIEVRFKFSDETGGLAL